MQQYVVSSPGVFEVRQAEPALLGANDVRVAMKAWSLNYRDLMILQGTYGAPRPGTVPLSDGAGEVIEVGSAVKRFQVGDRVTPIFMQGWVSGGPRAEYSKTALGGAIDGLLAEQVVLNEQGLVEMPVGYSYEQAATLPCAAVTAWNALFGDDSFHAQDRVLVMGTGGVSVFAAQFTAAAGGRVVLISGSDEKIKRLKGIKIEAHYNYRTNPNWTEDVEKLTDKLGVERVIEIGGSGTLNQSIEVARVGGTIAMIGVLTGVRGDVETAKLLRKSTTIRGIFVGSRAHFEAMNEFIVQHKIQPVIQETFPFADVPAAYAALKAAQHVGKIVISR